AIDRSRWLAAPSGFLSPEAAHGSSFRQPWAATRVSTDADFGRVARVNPPWSRMRFANRRHGAPPPSLARSPGVIRAGFGRDRGRSGGDLGRGDRALRSAGFVKRSGEIPLRKPRRLLPHVPRIFSIITRVAGDLSVPAPPPPRALLRLPVAGPRF